ncbi:MAG: phosphoglucosamine mutase, partial [Thermoplasmata archaeon]|nr:phosphoglucosamine mutase [Thermoplasmata archaeon]
SEYLAEIPRFSVIRKRVPMDRSKSSEIMLGVKDGLERLGPQEISELDGVRTVFEKGWILLRPSGTEPKLKIVIEGDTDEDAQSLLDLAEGVVKEVLG